MSSSRVPGPALDARHRCVDEARIIDLLAIEGWAQEWSEGRLVDARRGAAAALDLAIAAGAGFALTASGARLFDPLEVEDALEWLAVTGRKTLWTDQTAHSRVAFIAATRAGDRPLDAGQAGEPGRTRFRVTFHRVFDLFRFSPGGRIRLRLPAPVRSDYHREVAVTPLCPADLSAAVAVGDGRVEFRLEVPESPRVALGAVSDFVGGLPAPRGDAGRLSERDAELHLRPSEGLIEITPAVREAAGRLAAGLTPRAAVAAFWTFLVDGFHFRTVRYEEILGESACDWALRTRSYDCLVSAALLVALCRARGIPARLVSGHFLCRLAPTNHGWVEVWIDDMGWMPVDISHHARSDPQWGPHRDWWSHFARRWDYRMVFERLPLDFTGPMSVRFPPAWQMLHTPLKPGIAITYTDIADGSLIYQDRVTVDWTAET